MEDSASLDKEKRDGDQSSAVSKGSVDGGIYGQIRDTEKVPCCTGRIALASHTAITVGSGRQAVARPEFRRVNTVLSNLKTAISRTYHAFKFAKYVHRYLAEVQYRFNRRFDLSSILVRLVRVASLTGPRPESMIRLAEVGG